ncbi:uncharacterized protein LOC144135045 isoform X1 [Amblyomma americanum]
MSGKYLVVSIPLVALVAKATAESESDVGPSTNDPATRASQSTEDGRAQQGSSAETVVRHRQRSRLTAVDRAWLKLLQALLVSAEDERSHRRIEHEQRMKMIIDEHAFNEDERRKRNVLHEMKVRVLEAKEQVLNLEKEILRKKQQLLAA